MLPPGQQQLNRKSQKQEQ
uniref:Uncharacterized protein n=1 Tax=Anguilla anguilla TaxID=7936 RepID=A0A0E9XBE2_ANGAN